MNPIFSHGLAAMCGGVVGVVMMCLAFVAGEDDDEEGEGDD